MGRLGLGLKESLFNMQNFSFTPSRLFSLILSFLSKQKKPNTTPRTFDPNIFEKVYLIMVNHSVIQEYYVRSSELKELYGVKSRYTYDDSKEVKIFSLVGIGFFIFVAFFVLSSFIPDVVLRVVAASVLGGVGGAFPSFFIARRVVTNPPIRILAQIDGDIFPLPHPIHTKDDYEVREQKTADGTKVQKVVPQGNLASSLYAILKGTDMRELMKTNNETKEKLELALMVGMCLASLFILFLFGTANFGKDDETINELTTAESNQIITDQMKIIDENNLLPQGVLDERQYE